MKLSPDVAAELLRVVEDLTFRSAPATPACPKCGNCIDEAAIARAHEAMRKAYGKK